MSIKTVLGLALLAISVVDEVPVALAQTIAPPRPLRYEHAIWFTVPEAPRPEMVPTVHRRARRTRKALPALA